jgi:hypothetical protein
MTIINVGYTVYHGTAFEHLLSITYKIENVASAWGETELGPGFYTTVTVGGAAAGPQLSEKGYEVWVQQGERRHELKPKSCGSRDGEQIRTTI